MPGVTKYELHQGVLMERLSNGALIPDNRPELVQASRQLLRLELNEIQVLRGRRSANPRRPVRTHILFIKNPKPSVRRRIETFHSSYANHRALVAALRRDQAKAARCTK